MKIFKLVETILQLALIVLIGISFLVDDTGVLNPGILLITFAVVQIISMLVNKAAGPQVWKQARWRKIHLYGVGAVILIIIIAAIQGSGGGTGDKDDKYNMDGLGTLLFALLPAIALGAFYTVITITEWMKWRKTK